RLNNGTGTVVWGSPNFDPGKLVLGSPTGYSFGGGSVVFENGLDLNGATRTVRTDDPNGGGDRIRGGIANSTGTAGLVKEGAGALRLTAANTYNGPTTVTGGVLRANDGQGLPAAGNLTLDGGVLESAGPAGFTRTLGTAGGQVQFGAGGGGFSAFGG